MKSKLHYFGLRFISVCFRRKLGFSTPTHNLVSDCRVTGELGLSCQFLAGAGIARRSCYTPADAASLWGFSGAAVAAVVGKEKWRQTKVAACPPLSSSFWMTVLKMAQVVPERQGSGIRKLRERENRKEFELLIMTSNLSWYSESFTQRERLKWCHCFAIMPFTIDGS